MVLCFVTHEISSWSQMELCDLGLVHTADSCWIDMNSACKPRPCFFLLVDLKSRRKVTSLNDVQSVLGSQGLIYGKQKWKPQQKYSYLRFLLQNLPYEIALYSVENHQVQSYRIYDIHWLVSVVCYKIQIWCIYNLHFWRVNVGSGVIPAVYWKWWNKNKMCVNFQYSMLLLLSFLAS